jgi:hypothetical protein
MSKLTAALVSFVGSLCLVLGIAVLVRFPSLERIEWLALPGVAVGLSLAGPGHGVAQAFLGIVGEVAWFASLIYVALHLSKKISSHS